MPIYGKTPKYVTYFAVGTPWVEPTIDLKSEILQEAIEELAKDVDGALMKHVAEVLAGKIDAQIMAEAAEAFVPPAKTIEVHPLDALENGERVIVLE